MTLPRLPAALLAAAALSGALLCTPGARAAGTCVTVEVQNVRPQQGHLMAAAFGGAAQFGKQPMATLRVAAGEAVTRFELCGITSPMLSISMFQDLDSDGKMGTNLMGVPTEPWGSSGQPGPFGPSWETGKVPASASPIVVRLSA